ncbi:hypothetical protein Tco_0562301 [Tanacetum coccineum]
MSALKFADSHNMVAFLAKPTESEGFKQIVDFLNANPIKYALTMGIKKKVIITKTSVRRDLQLEDAKGIECLPNADNFEQLALMGYEKPSRKLTFYKAFFSPKWKFFIHTILQCLSAKSIAWNEFCSTMASVRDHQILIDPHHTPIDTHHQQLNPKETKTKSAKSRKETENPQSMVLSEPIADESANEKNEQSEKVVEEVVSTAEVSVAAIITTEEITLAQALAELRSAKPKVVVQEPVHSTTTTTPLTIPKAKSITFRDPSESIIRTTLTPIPSNIKDKGKAKMIEPEKPLKKKDQVLFDEQEAIRLQAQFDKEKRIAREKEEANAALIAQWNDIQDKVETDYKLAQRLQAEEQEELTIKEKSKLFQQLLEKRRKHFAAKRAKERRNKPPTKAQQRSIMTTYLKNMAG